MIFQRIDFHNVADMTPADGGWLMWRLPEDVRARTNEGLRTRVCHCNSGVELRFRIRGEGVTLILKSEPEAEAQVAHIYYGSIQGGWENSARVIGTAPTRVHIPAPKNLPELRRISENAHLPFDPELVRLVLPYGTCVYMGCEGDVEPPRPGDTPARTYLAYGSSITHGSLALDMPHTYPFRIAQMLGCDYLNLGFAGTAHAEEAVARHIAGRGDWDFASVELGINMLGFSEAEFEARIDRFTAILAGDPRPVFATSIFVFNGEQQEKGRRFREIVRRYAGERLIFTDGLDLLENPAFIAQDLVHPSLEGAEQIARRWSAVMADRLPR
ncbi:MAG: SGNH/GDSL hydrolase family protein [Aristaeellaceae bacterium]